MALKILLADDSMTAQNMGKKILVDAGYEVVAVSNGAAALKKIAELKPDIAVLDIYMPGYTGLEVCERVKSSPMTAKMPVLLTVGKMEPYRPEDGARVNADGVIIKPFEASDLIAAVGKLAELVAVKQASVAPKYEAEYEEDSSYQQASEVANASNDPAAASAFAAMMSGPAMMDEFSVDFPVHENVPAFEAAKPFGFAGFSVDTSQAAGFEMPMSEAPAFGLEDAHPVATMIEEAMGPAAAEVQTPEVRAEAVQEEQVAATSDLASQGEEFAIHPEPFPETPFELESTALVLNEPSPVEVAPSEELEFTSAPQVGEVELVQEDALESPVEEEVVISAEHDPALATSPDDFVEFATHVGESNPEPTPVGIFVDYEEEMSVETEPLIESAEAAEFVPAPTEEAIAEDVALPELPKSIESPAAGEELIAAEESVAAFEEPVVKSETSEDPGLAEVPAVEPKSWMAEETMVLPAESMALLEEEMRQSLTETVPAPESVTDPFEDDILGSAFEEVPEVVPEPTDATAESVAEPEASSVTTDEDREFAARLAAALNEIPSDQVFIAPEELLPDDATETCDATETRDTALAAVEETALANVEVEPTGEILEAQDSLVEEAPKAMAAAASFPSAPPASSDALRIADVVHRVFERYKEQMAAEIAQELSKEQ